MQAGRVNPERVNLFSDAVIAVVITIMVLELRPPEHADLASLVPLWPIIAGYAVSYLFIAIIWTNHHHLMRFVRHASPKLIWLNFAHLFAVSLIPFTTGWLAESRLSATPVAVYAALFALVDLAYLAFEQAVIAQADPEDFPRSTRRIARRRTLSTVAIFLLAVGVAMLAPWLAFMLICAALALYVRPDPVNARG